MEDAAADDDDGDLYMLEIFCLCLFHEKAPFPLPKNCTSITPHKTTVPQDTP